VAVAALRQKMAAAHLLIWLQQFAHQFCERDVKSLWSMQGVLARDLLDGVEKPTPHRLV
jgi:TorA maturation chaperone TorD